MLLQGAEAGSSASTLRSTAARRLRAPTAESWSSIGCGQEGGADVGNMRAGRASAAGRQAGTLGTKIMMTIRKFVLRKFLEIFQRNLSSEKNASH